MSKSNISLPLTNSIILKFDPPIFTVHIGTHIDGALSLSNVVCGMCSGIIDHVWSTTILSDKF